MQLGDSLARRRRRRRGGGDGGDDGEGGDWGDGWDEPPRRRRRTDPIFSLGPVLPFLGLALLGGGLGYILATKVFFPAAPPPRDVQEVPGLIGLDESEARDALADAGLALGNV